MSATENQKTAIKNLLSYMICLDKHNHFCLSKSNMKIIESMTFKTASNQIDKLIRDVKDFDEERNDYDYAHQERLWK